MNSALMKVLFVLLTLFILITITNQVYTAVREPYDTETAVIYSSADKISFKGVYIRDESVIRHSYDGVLSYPWEDGGKVANGSVVAYVYGSEEDIGINRQIEALEDEIALLKAAQNPGTVLTAQPEFISSLISEQYRSLETKIAKKDIADIKENRDELLTLMSIYQISIGQEDNYDSLMNELYVRIADLRKKQREYKYAIVSPDAGYFVSGTDGWESRLTMENADSLDADVIKEVIQTEQSGGGSRSKSDIGKLVKGYNWKIAGIIDNSDSIYNAGDEVSLSFVSTPDKVNAVIEKLEPTDDPEEWVLVLRCEEMTFDLVKKRVERVEMTLNDFEGIRVPRSALRFNKNNEKGCYVLWGQRVLFKKVEPVFEDDDYILSKLTADEDYVCVYDDIIIEGVDTAAFKANEEDTDSGGDYAQESEEYTEEPAAETDTVEEQTAEETSVSDDENSADNENDDKAIDDLPPGDGSTDEADDNVGEDTEEGEVHFE